jgi:competence protein ComEC
LRLEILAFFAGIVFLQLGKQLPSLHFLYILVLIIIIALFFVNKYPCFVRYLFVFALGYTWCLAYIYIQKQSQLIAEEEGKTVIVTGYIASIPQSSLAGTTFLFSIQEKNQQKWHGLVKLSWHNLNLPLQAGEQWQLYVKLKKPYGTMNPYGYDFERWVQQAGIKAIGYVVPQMQNQRLSIASFHYPLVRVRQYLQKKISQHMPKSETSAWIMALCIGERTGIPASSWTVLRNTGTNHLMAIAGLHIGLMAALAHYLISWLWRRIPCLCLWLPAANAGGIAALMMALTYSAMAGFSLPTQRACIMLSVFLVTILFKRNIGSWHAWCFALLIVLLLNPLSVLEQSFWLSFGSVALIIYGVGGRLHATGLWWQWGRIQWVIAVGLIPLSLVLFNQCSLISFVANAIAIPWVGFLVVPLCLLGCFCLAFSQGLAGFILYCADKVLALMWAVLTWLSNLPHVVWYQSVPSVWLWLMLFASAILLLLPQGAPGRYLACLGVLPIFLYKPAGPAFGDAWLTLLDVGQGLSAVVQTQHHVLVFDAGPAVMGGIDMGESVVTPFLHSIAINKLDMLVISHADNDHIGGAKAILNQFPALSIQTSTPSLLTNANYCLKGNSWFWDGVDFNFLHPGLSELGLGNDSSCVLRITAHDKNVLLTGDIEKQAEKTLLNHLSQQLAADILIAPHHGSKTSAVKNFVYAIHPRYVLYAVGYRNRYHFPHASVLKIYDEINAVSYQTDKTGAIQFKLTSQETLTPSLYRLEHKHYWNN